MIRHLHIARSVEKQLKALRRAGKKGEWAARQCETLLDLIRNGGLKSEAVLGKRTRNGEYRIGNCVKYNLGHGYRLVTVKDGRRLFLPFVGGHDETDQWLDRHRCDEFTVGDPAYVVECITPPEQTQKTEADCEHCIDDEPIDPYEEQLRQKVDESTLRTVFHGLFQSQGRERSE